MKTLCSTFFFLTAMTQPRQVCLHFPFDSLHVFQSVRTLQAMTSDRTGQSWNCSQPQHRSTLFLSREPDYKLGSACFLLAKVNKMGAFTNRPCVVKLWFLTIANKRLFRKPTLLASGIAFFKNIKMAYQQAELVLLLLSARFRYPQVEFLSSHTSNVDDRDPPAAVANEDDRDAWRGYPDVVQYVPLGKYCLPCEPQFNGHPTWLASNDTSIVKKARHVFSRHVCASAGGGKQTSEVDPALPGLGPRDWTAWDNNGW